MEVTFEVGFQRRASFIQVSVEVDGLGHVCFTIMPFYWRLKFIRDSWIVAMLDLGPLHLSVWRYKR